MALMYNATLTPTKLELLSAWLPSRAWYRGPASPVLERVVSYRIDDPAGEVGVETMVVRDAEGTLFQTPMTYRHAPLEGAEAWFMGNSDHSVLGNRWIYDACGDPLYARLLSGLVLTGTGQAEEFIDVDGEAVRRDPAMRVVGTGSLAQAPNPGSLVRVDDADPTVIVTEHVELSLVRVLRAANTGAGDSISATWDGQSEPLLLAYARAL